MRISALQIAATFIVVLWLGLGCSSGRQASCGTGSRPVVKHGVLVVNRSIGPVALGETRSEVEKQLGCGRFLSEHPQQPRRGLRAELVEYPKSALYVVYARIRGHEARVIDIETYDARYRTSKSVGVGSDSGDVLTRVGDMEVSKVRFRSIPHRDVSELQARYAHEGSKPVTTFLIRWRMNRRGQPDSNSPLGRVIVSYGRWTRW